MAYPDNILTLQTTKDGSPWVRVTARSNSNIDTLIVSKDGSPWWVQEVVSGAVTTLKMYVGSVQVSKVYLGETEVTKIYVGDVQV